MVKSLCSSARPPREIRPWQWAERHVKIAVTASGQRWSSDDATFIREIMESFGDEGVREITCKCSAQSGKTLTLLALVCWIIVNDPGPILWVCKSVNEAKKLMKTRLKPMLEMCLPVAERMPTDRSLNTMLEIYFPGSSLILTGAETDAALQSTPFRYVIMDEARSYPKGAVEMASKRLRSYTHSSKRIIISTPNAENDVVDRNYKAGDRRAYHVTCSKCGDEHEMEWGKKNEDGEGHLKGGLKWTPAT